MTAPARPGVLLVLTNLGDERCGVGSSEAVVAGGAPVEVQPLDPVAGSLPAFVRRVRSARAGVAGAVLAYPTIEQHERLRLVPRLLLLRALLGRHRWVRLHLHEFDHLRRRQRVVVALLTGLVADKVVVSSTLEAAALRTRYRGWAGRRDVVVVPPANASAPSEPLAGLPAPDPDRPTVGIVGQYRPDKDEAWLFDVLARLDGGFRRLEVVGRGWDALAWPPAVLDRYEVVLHGEVPACALSRTLAPWDLAVAPFDHHVHDGRLSLRTPLAHGVPTLTPGPRPDHLQLAPPHLHLDDEVDVAALRPASPSVRAAGAAAVAELEARWRAELVTELYGP